MNKGVLTAIIIAAATLVLLLFLPRTPPGEKAESDPPPRENPPVKTEDNELDERVDKAVRIIESGEGPPMKAIGELKAVVDEDPEHLRANYYLGYFSVMSGQHEKALDRLEVVLSLDSTHADAHLLMGEALEQTGQKEEAESHYRSYLEFSDDEEGKRELRKKLTK